MRTSRRLVLASALTVAATAGVPSLTPADDSETAGLQERLETFVGLVPGAAAAVTVRDGVITSATTGILDDQGGEVTPETPFQVGPLGMPMTVAVVLQLVDEGRIELDERVSTYLPDAPVAPNATVRHLLSWQAGIPDNYGQLIDLTLRDPGRGWSREELIDTISPEMVGIAGDRAPTIGHEIVAELLIEAVEGQDMDSVLHERMREPLGLTDTRDTAREDAQPDDLALGWELGLGLAGDPNAELAGLQTLDGRSSSAIDTVRFLQGLIGGAVISEESMALVFDENAVFSSMGFDTHEEALGHLGDLGTRYYLANGNLISGYAGSLAVSPETGDIVVILASNDELPTWEFLHETVSTWAEEDG